MTIYIVTGQRRYPYGNNQYEYEEWIEDVFSTYLQAVAYANAQAKLLKNDTRYHVSEWKVRD